MASSGELLPCVVFAFNRPNKLRRILEALRPQGVQKLIVYVDGPRGPHDQPGVTACREAARQVDWVETELNFLEENHGARRLDLHMNRVLEQHAAAIFIEDDCLPMPGFYAFMRRALEIYRHAPQVFSIGGYQPVRSAFFRDYPFALVGSLRFLGWGWATWRDRWLESAAYRERFSDLFDGFRQVPDIAGADLIAVAQSIAAGQPLDDWDYRTLVASLALKKLHLLPVRGLVRNIGLDRSGTHGSFVGSLRDLYFHNRNLAGRLPEDLPWPQDPAVDCEYAAALREWISRSRMFSSRALLLRGRVLFRRYIWPRRERLLAPPVDGAARARQGGVFYSGGLWSGVLPPDTLAPHPPAAPQKRALLSYITHPFFIPQDDPRFLNHINIWHAHQFVQALNRLGYRVDVIGYQDREYAGSAEFLHRAGDYDLFIGHGGANFVPIAGQLSPAARKLLFVTTSYWKFHNQAEAARLEALQQRRSLQLPMDRPILDDEDQALRLASGVIGIGNAVTRGTYPADLPLVMIDGASLYDMRFDWCPKDYASGRRHFVFFASRGSVHKGLDLLLEAFAGWPGSDAPHLWVCSLLEPEFARLYHAELSRFENIHLIGRLEARGAQFYRVMQRANFCLLPSCSEGQSQAVLECMNQGLIPLVSREAGLDVADFGRLIEPCSIPSIREVVQAASGLAPEACQAMSLKARAVAQNAYSPAAFAARLQAEIANFLR